MSLSPKCIMQMSNSQIEPIAPSAVHLYNSQDSLEMSGA